MLYLSCNSMFILYSHIKIQTPSERVPMCDCLVYFVTQCKCLIPFYIYLEHLQSESRRALVAGSLEPASRGRCARRMRRRRGHVVSDVIRTAVPRSGALCRVHVQSDALWCHCGQGDWGGLCWRVFYNFKGCIILRIVSVCHLFILKPRLYDSVVSIVDLFVDVSCHVYRFYCV